MSRPRTWRNRHDQPLEGRRVWDIGDWGNASNHIGRHWEEFGIERLRHAVAAHGELLEILGTPAQDRFSRLGLTNPDAILVERHDGLVHLRAVDCKWSLETASTRQVGVDALESLLPHLASQLNSHGKPTLGPGFFFAPRTTANQRFLRSPQNDRRPDPIQPNMVVLEDLEVDEFFPSLPGWHDAERLASLDRAEPLLLTVDGAEHYYRLGVGIAGALKKLATPVFADRPPDAHDTVTALEALRADVDPLTTPRIVSYLGRRLDERADRVARLRRLTHCPYTMRSMARALARAGIQIPDPYSKDPGSSVILAPWRALHRLIAEEYRARVSAEGLRLMAEGHDEFATLVAFERDESARVLWAREIGERSVNEAIVRVRQGLPAVP